MASSMLDLLSEIINRAANLLWYGEKQWPWYDPEQGSYLRTASHIHSLRLACRALYQHTFNSSARYHFQHLHVSLDRHTLTWLLIVSNHPEFAGVVRDVQIWPGFYDRGIAERRYRLWFMRNNHGKVAREEDYQERIYRVADFLEAQQQFIDERGDEKLLTAALKQLRNIVTVEIGCTPHCHRHDRGLHRGKGEEANFLLSNPTYVVENGAFSGLDALSRAVCLVESVMRSMYRLCSRSNAWE
jgi:hypothetical protein